MIVPRSGQQICVDDFVRRFLPTLAVFKFSMARLKHKLLFIALALALSCWLICCQSNKPELGQPAGNEQEIIRLDQQLAEAEMRQDNSVLENLLADDFIYTTPNGETLTRSQRMAQKSPLKDVIIKSISLDDQRVRFYGETAVATGRGTQQLQIQGKDISGQYRYTRVYVKRDGRWQAVAMQAAVVAQPPAPAKT